MGGWDRPRAKNGQFARRDDGAQAGAAAGRSAPRAAARGAKRGKAGQAKGATGGFTPEKERTFFRELSMLCNVSEALRKVRLLGRSADVYERKRLDPAFRVAWEASVREGYSLLDLEMLERARFGDERPAPHTDVEKRLRGVSTRLGLQLLKMHAGRVAAAPAAAAPPAAARKLRRSEAAAARRELDDLLDELHRRLAAQG